MRTYLTQHNINAVLGKFVFHLAHADRPPYVQIVVDQEQGEWKRRSHEADLHINKAKSKSNDRENDKRQEYQYIDSSQTPAVAEQKSKNDAEYNRTPCLTDQVIWTGLCTVHCRSGNQTVYRIDSPESGGDPAHSDIQIVQPFGDVRTLDSALNHINEKAYKKDKKYIIRCAR